MQQETFPTRMFAAARQARQAPTQAERALWEMVRDHRCGGWGFRRQVMRGPFRMDFYCAGARLAIEIDGGIRFLRLSNEDVLYRPQHTMQRILEAAGLNATGPSPRRVGRGGEAGVGLSTNE